MISTLKKRIIGVAVVLALIAGGLVFGIVKQYLHWRELQQEINRAEERLLELNNQFARLNLLQKQGDLLASYLQRINEAMPQEIREEELVAVFQEATAGMSGSIEAISFKEVVAKAGYRELPVQLVFKGEFQELLLFLQQLGEHHRIFRVEEISIDSDINNILIKANIEITAVYGST